MMFTDDNRFAVACALRDWIHRQPWSECGLGVDTCPDWPKAFEIRDVALRALEKDLSERQARGVTQKIVERAARAAYEARSYGEDRSSRTPWAEDAPGHVEFDRIQWRIRARAALEAVWPEERPLGRSTEEWVDLLQDKADSEDRLLARAEAAEARVKELEADADRIVENMLQMDTLRRCMEERTELKLQLREIRAQSDAMVEVMDALREALTSRRT